MSSRKEKELKEVIEQQKEQISRYEKKLRGNISAKLELKKPFDKCAPCWSNLHINWCNINF